ncbi:helix-turn-helix transcriptional regulator [Anoxybacillus flavithermus]|uniref:DNA-binding response regulator, NarL family, with truncated N-terminal REC domain n=1 Tax=Anoxybacillus flavithermus (strain DSM 21510 / WK1) TaxID=491915 RepID=B7GM39_ANOFW|nr:LuxR C-terminal-related transcriptional regulator [Anoxybacillus flavithermus]ACJ34577.1 DNA-binding response regulator, NarL family, with truncated N-terminal REC domain [Anoxybacillus flavithermus WK1]
MLNQHHGYEYIYSISFDILIMHIPILDTKTLEWVRRSKRQSPIIHFILICPCYYPAVVSTAYEAGVSAIVTSEIFKTQFPNILQQVANGQTLFLIEQQPPLCKLNDTEIRILQMVSNDFTNRQISEKLNISKRTVERHLSSCFEKLGAHSRAGAIAAAMRLKLIE